ncbi:MAG: glycosyl transferase family protein [Microgenomates group bacterium Gr01-1014_16]|nr:MAG: glycosyl transferase family protein [Microgenomates group bacterium Gr01-1014_16]
MSNPYLSVVISAYNEEDNLHRGTIDVMVDFLKKKDFSWELIIVNDGSTDSTSEFLHQVALGKSEFRVIDNLHMGKAAGIITGALAAWGEIILFTDMDQATPIVELDKFLPKFKEGYNIVIGSRANREGAPMFRQILAKGQVIMRAIILRLPFRDTQCGFKAFTHEAAHKIFTLMNKINPPVVITGPAVTPGFDVELLYLGRKMGYRIAEIPVSWRYQESRRVRFFKDMIDGLKGLFLVRLRSLTNAYKL